MPPMSEIRSVVKAKAGQFPKQWAEKVDKMSDAQVTAIYIRMKNSGKL